MSNAYVSVLEDCKEAGLDDMVDEIEQANVPIPKPQQLSSLLGKRLSITCPGCGKVLTGIRVKCLTPTIHYTGQMIKGNDNVPVKPMLVKTSPFYDMTRTSSNIFTCPECYWTFVDDWGDPIESEQGMLALILEKGWYR